MEWIKKIFLTICLYVVVAVVLQMTAFKYQDIIPALFFSIFITPLVIYGWKKLTTKKIEMEEETEV